MSLFRRAAALSCLAPSVASIASIASIASGCGHPADPIVTPAADATALDAEVAETSAPDAVTFELPLAVAADLGLPPECLPVHADAGASADEAGAHCERRYDLPCGVPTGVATSAGCGLPVADCWSLCSTLFAQSCRIVDTGCLNDAGAVAETGPVVLLCDLCAAGAGRRPPCLRAQRTRGASRDVGAYFATLAHLEAASAPAFRRMVRELAALGAPRALVRAAANAARDEVRHARTTTRLARRFGSHPAAPRLGRARLRTLEQLARDNEVEGCVRETYGALLAHVQASRAGDRDVARELAHIAADESRHAALSWAIAHWARGRLAPDAVDRLNVARRAAVDDLLRELRPVSVGIASVAGVPPIDVQQRLARALESSLWLA